jgi:hypothetical protein
LKKVSILPNKKDDLSKVVFSNLEIEIIVCISSVSLSQSENADSNKVSAKPENQLKDWQTIELAGEGIKFKLPPDWKKEDFNLKNKTELTDSEMLEWNTPGGKFIRIYKAILLKGFLDSKEAILGKDYRRREKDIFYNELKYLTLGSARGIIYITKLEWEGEKRITVNWRAFRDFQKEAQMIDVTVGGNVRDEYLLKTILESFKVAEN